MHWVGGGNASLEQSMIAKALFGMATDVWPPVKQAVNVSTIACLLLLQS